MALGPMLPDMVPNLPIRNVAAGVLLAMLVFFAFGGALENDFVRFDDDDYVFENAKVSQGLTGAGLRWALTTGHAANWHPLTWLSHMADVELYGLRPAGHHGTSVLLHALNAMLLFAVLAILAERIKSPWFRRLVAWWFLLSVVAWSLGVRRFL